MSDGTREARAAADWWAEQLAGNAPTNVGSARSNLFADVVRAKLPRPTTEQVDAFRAHLYEAILAHLADPSNAWANAVADGDPRRGSALRAFGVDYGPDPILDDALAAAGIENRKLALPLKTVMWVNPDSVSVGLGFNAPARELDLPEWGPK